MNNTDKFLITGGLTSLFTLVLHLSGIIPEAVAWFLLGMTVGCILVGAIDALRRSLDLW